MNVIAIKSTKKLNKDGVYKVASLQNQNTRSSPYFTPTVRIYLRDNSVQTFSLSGFKPESGTTFPNIIWMDSDYQQMLNERDQMKIDKNLKSGDYVVPVHDGLKTLIKGRKYKVNEVVSHDQLSSRGTVSWTDIKIKLEGSQRLYVAYNFRKCTSQEVREISLKELFDEKSETEKVNRFKRKFDKWRIRIPRDQNSISKQGRLRSTHFIVTLYFDNTKNRQLIMNRLMSYFDYQIF